MNGKVIIPSKVTMEANIVTDLDLDSIDAIDMVIDSYDYIIGDTTT